MCTKGFAIILANQNAFVKGRSIFAALRTIDEVVDFTKRNCLPIDSEKAFDTLEFNFFNWNCA